MIFVRYYTHDPRAIALHCLLPQAGRWLMALKNNCLLRSRLFSYVLIKSLRCDVSVPVSGSCLLGTEMH